MVSTWYNWNSQNDAGVPQSVDMKPKRMDYL